jgi:hypothetical protein
MGHASTSFPKPGEWRACHASFERRPFRTKHPSFKLKGPVAGTEWNPPQANSNRFAVVDLAERWCCGISFSGREFFTHRLYRNRLMMVPSCR